jgi:hypothetical protein
MCSKNIDEPRIHVSIVVRPSRFVYPVSKAEVVA